MLSPDRFIVSYLEENSDYYGMYSYEDAKLAVMDQLFNTIGNGIVGTNQFLRYISIEDSELSEQEISDLINGIRDDTHSLEDIHDRLNALLNSVGSLDKTIQNTERKIKKEKRVKFCPYPNFDKNYSLVYELNFNLITEHKESWIAAIQDYYKQCIKYFNSDKSLSHMYAYPSNSERQDNQKLEDMKKRLTKNYKGFEEGIEEEFEKIAKDYGIESFNGDVHKMLCDIWVKNRNQWIEFSEEVIQYLENL